MEKHHNALWTAIDNLAYEKHISVSRMARLSHMDSTAFNKSKRFDVYGRPHWPSTETLTKMMRAMKITWHDFVKYIPEIHIPDDDED